MSNDSQEKNLHNTSAKNCHKVREFYTMSSKTGRQIRDYQSSLHYSEHVSKPWSCGAEESVTEMCN